MRYKAVIFDLDGVLVHTDRFHYLAWKAVADELGICFDEEINLRLKGVSRLESLEIILENYSGTMTKEEKLMIAEKKNRIYRESLHQLSPADVSAEVVNLLMRTKYLGIKTAIGSSSKNAGFILQKIGLQGWFDAISDGNSITKSKPDPEVFLNAATLLGVLPKDCLVVEDAAAGVQAALSAGMDCAVIGSMAKPQRGVHALKSISDLLNLLG
jgi:beta-phosphoglucomutase